MEEPPTKSFKQTATANQGLKDFLVLCGLTLLHWHPMKREEITHRPAHRALISAGGVLAGDRCGDESKMQGVGRLPVNPDL